MDLSNFGKEELTNLLNDVIDATVDELVKGEVFAGGPTDPDHGKPNLYDDFAESDAVVEQEGATAKAEEKDDEDEEDEENPFAEKSNTEVATLLKSQMKGLLDVNKTISALNDKIDRLSKSKARERKSVMNEKDVEVVQKGKADEDLNGLIFANKGLVAEKLLDLQKANKIRGDVLTSFELFGAAKLPEGLKKSILQEADLLK